MKHPTTAPVSTSEYIHSGRTQETHSCTRKRHVIEWILPVTGLFALLWFCVRVIPRPARAAYPCQRVAAPLASSFILWGLSFIGSAFAYWRIRVLLQKSSLHRWVTCLVLGSLAAVIAIANLPAERVVAEIPRQNEPIGVAQGIHPGRVVWVHDSHATDWEGTNYDGEDIGDGYWWESEHTDQAVVDSMMSQAIRAVADEDTDTAAWNVIFRHFNEEHGSGAAGYQAGEKVCIKVNLVTANRGHENVDAEGNQTQWLGWVNTSPQMILALLRQLVYVVGVAQDDITVGDPTAYFPNHYWNHCHPEFPEVHYLAWTEELGRHEARSSEGEACETPVYWSTDEASGARQDYLPVSYAEATYLINLTCLKGHSAGVTLCAKNHYGSLIRLPSEGDYYNLHFSLPNSYWTPGMGHYRAHVDIMGHAHLGGKTVLSLVDGLYGGYHWEGRPYKWLLPPFGDGANGDWPSSLFASQDAVAIDSVCYDFLFAEWPDVVSGGVEQPGSLEGGAEDYLHEAALAHDPPSATIYDPDGDGENLPSLGVHEHWNNATDKLYSRNLGTGDGIELVAIATGCIGDINHDAIIDLADLAQLLANYGTTSGAAYEDGDQDGNGSVDLSDLAALLAVYGTTCE